VSLRWYRSISSAADRFYLYVSAINPLLFMALYLVLTIAYATAYWSRPGGEFYEPYATYEPAAVNDAEEVAQTIILAIQRQLNPKRIKNAYIALADGRKILLDGVGIDHVKVKDENQISFNLNLPLFYHNENDSHSWAGTYSHALLHLAIINKKLPPDFKKLPSTASDEVICHAIHVDDQRIETTEIQNAEEEYLRIVFDPANTSLPCIGISDNEKKFLSTFMEGYGGDPSAIRYSYLRMLYLSMVVITTLGLGDIVPLTSLTRFLVGTEAFVGVLLAGFFLNAVFARVASLAKGP
jgi:hypothetical protein